MSDPEDGPAGDLSPLLSIMARLRDPERGCPWDRQQDFASIAPYTIEEAYEVDEAIRAGDMDALRDELGDLLFQTVFHARMAQEAGAFDFDDVVAAVVDKMVRRHPHVFGGADIATADAQTASWEALKAAERKKKARGGILDDVPVALPALLRAQKLQKRAARVGFDWPSADEVLEKIVEESREVAEAVQSGDPDKVADEVGDLIFNAVNLARKLGADAEDSLRRCNAKFERRFRFIEQVLEKSGRTPDQSTLEEMDGLWNAAKAAERG
jgi:tetrapyrrole methylase family protein/MazG family protein/ATP diphosphatase